MTLGVCLPSKPQMALGLDNLMGLIIRLSHIRQAITGSTKEYPVAPVSNNAVVFISPLFSSIHGATNASSAKKLPGRLDDDTINGFSSTCNSSARGFPQQGTSVGHALVRDSFCFDFCMVTRLTLSSLFSFCLLGQSVVLWPTALHKKHLLSFNS